MTSTNVSAAATSRNGELGDHPVRTRVRTFERRPHTSISRHGVAHTNLLCLIVDRRRVGNGTWLRMAGRRSPPGDGVWWTSTRTQKFEVDGAASSRTKWWAGERSLRSLRRRHILTR